MSIEKELDEAAGEAIFGMQLTYEKAIAFVMKNVGNQHTLTREQAEHAVRTVMIRYKM